MESKLLHYVTSLPHAIAQAIVDDLEVLDTSVALSTFLAQHIRFDIDADNLDSLLLQLSSRLTEEKSIKLIEKDLLHFIDKATYTGWTTSGHTAIDVPIFAYGKASSISLATKIILK